MKDSRETLPITSPFAEKGAMEDQTVRVFEVEGTDRTLAVLNTLTGEVAHAEACVLHLSDQSYVFRDEESCSQLEAMRQAGHLPNIVGIRLSEGDDWSLMKRFALNAAIPFVQESRRGQGKKKRGDGIVPFLATAINALKRESRRTPHTSLLFAVCAVLLLIGGGLGFPLLFQHTTIHRRASPPPVLGEAAFTNSPQGGINDEIQIHIPRLPVLSAGKTYSVWLISDQEHSDALWVNVGSLKADGSLQTLSPDNASHADLLATYSRVCITADGTFLQPTRSACRYYGEITQRPNDNDLPDHYSLLDHVRHLLASDPTLELLHIHRGLVYNFTAQLGKINEWASAAATEAYLPLVHRHMVRILDALDGSRFVEKDVPAGTGLMVDPTSIGVGVLRGDAGTPSYLGHIEKHVRGILNSPGVTPEQVRTASLVLEAMQHIAIEMQRVYNDARSLVRLSDAQLALATETLQDLATDASNAYAGGYETALAQTRVLGSKDVYIIFQKFGMIDVFWGQT
ncbi:MAG: hypothetical protein NVSMB49_23740 [Ktedonobacteraceae bacterium]